MLTVSDLDDAFMELGTAARDAGKVIDIAVYGGSALMLASNFRVSTRDVDAVVEQDDTYIQGLIRELGDRRGWPRTWLNDGVKTYLSPNVDGLGQHHRLFRAYPSEGTPGLRVFVPTPEYLLAMKLMAMRLDAASESADLTDILNLLEVLGVGRKDDLVAFVGRFYPEAKISGRLVLGLAEVWRQYDAWKATPHAAPSYLGRSGPKNG